MSAPRTADKPDVGRAVERLRGLAAFYHVYCSGLNSPIQRVKDKARARRNNAEAIHTVLDALSASESRADAMATLVDATLRWADSRMGGVALASCVREYRAAVAAYESTQHNRPEGQKEHNA